MSRWQPMAEQLVAERYGALVGYAALLTRNRHDAEEIVQEALVRTFTRTARFDSIGHAEAYVRRAIASRFIDEKRSLSRRRRREHAVAVPEAVDGPDGWVEPDPELAAALGSLAPRVRACVALRYLADQSYAEISHALGIAEGTARRNVHDGVKALAAVLGTGDDVVEHAPVTSKGGGA